MWPVPHSTNSPKVTAADGKQPAADHLDVARHGAREPAALAGPAHGGQRVVRRGRPGEERAPQRRALERPRRGERQRLHDRDDAAGSGREARLERAHLHGQRSLPAGDDGRARRERGGDVRACARAGPPRPARPRASDANRGRRARSSTATSTRQTTDVPGGVSAMSTTDTITDCSWACAARGVTSTPTASAAASDNTVYAARSP
jgi:hypothetical protein